MVKLAENLQPGDVIRLGVDSALEVQESRIVRYPALTGQYTHVRVWFTDETAMVCLRDREIECHEDQIGMGTA